MDGARDVGAEKACNNDRLNGSADAELRFGENSPASAAIFDDSEFPVDQGEEDDEGSLSGYFSPSELAEDVNIEKTNIDDSETPDHSARGPCVDHQGDREDTLHKEVKAVSSTLPYRSIDFITDWSFSLPDLLLTVIQRSTQNVAPDNVTVHVSVGRLVGSETRKQIVLPVNSLCVLEMTEDLDFIDSVPEGFGNEFFRRYFAGGVANGWALEELDASTPESNTGNKEVIYHLSDGSPATKIAICDSLETGKRREAKITTLSAWILYRPHSSFHLKVVCSTRRLEVAKTEGEQPRATLERIELVEKNLFVLRRTQRGTSTVADAAPNWHLLLLSTTPLPFPDSDADSQNSHESESDNNKSLVPSDPQESFILASRTSEEDPTPSVRLLLDWPYMVQLLKLSSSCSSVAPISPVGLILEFLGHANYLGQVADSDISCTQAVHGDTSMTLYFPTYFGDIASRAKRHYNTKQAHGIVAAGRSPIEALRRLNNEAKRLLIDDFCPRRARVLDLACGHGQDVPKYAEKNLTTFIGIDISSEEIKEAGRRLKHNARPVTYPYEFHVGSILQESAYRKLSGKVFDVVSIQLAIHYCFASPKQASFLLKKISEHLTIGGVFLGSTGCCDTFVDRLANGVTVHTADDDQVLSVSFGNNVYRVSLTAAQLAAIRGTDPALPLDASKIPLMNDSVDSNPVPAGASSVLNCVLQGSEKDSVRSRVRNTWGLLYRFWLLDHIDAEEYLVPWDAFVRAAAEVNLELTLHSTFDVFLKDGLQRNPRLKSWFNNQLSRLPFDQSQGDAFSFYKVFAFRKVQPGTIVIAPSIANCASPEMSIHANGNERDARMVPFESPSSGGPGTFSIESHVLDGSGSLGIASFPSLNIPKVPHVGAQSATTTSASTVTPRAKQRPVASKTKATTLAASVPTVAEQTLNIPPSVGSKAFADGRSLSSTVHDQSPTSNVAPTFPPPIGPVGMQFPAQYLMAPGFLPFIPGAGVTYPYFAYGTAPRDVNAMVTPSMSTSPFQANVRLPGISTAEGATKSAVRPVAPVPPSSYQNHLQTPQVNGRSPSGGKGPMGSFVMGTFNHQAEGHEQHKTTLEAAQQGFPVRSRGTAVGAHLQAPSSEMPTVQPNEISRPRMGSDEDSTDLSSSSSESSSSTSSSSAREAAG